jgi:hypothetical protein
MLASSDTTQFNEKELSAIDGQLLSHLFGVPETINSCFFSRFLSIWYPTADPYSKIPAFFTTV